MEETRGRFRNLRRKLSSLANRSRGAGNVAAGKVAADKAAGKVAVTPRSNLRRKLISLTNRSRGAGKVAAGKAAASGTLSASSAASATSYGRIRGAGCAKAAASGSSAATSAASHTAVADRRAPGVRRGLLFQTRQSHRRLLAAQCRVEVVPGLGRKRRPHSFHFFK